MDSLSSAIAKAQHHHGETWVGYLLPREILALVKAGAKPCGRQAEYYVSQAEKCVKEGKADSCCFYFKPNGITMLYYCVRHSKEKQT